VPYIIPMTFNGYAEVALAKWYEVEKLTPRTIASQRAILGKYILPILGDVPLYLLDNETMELRFLLKQLLQVKSYKTRRNRVGMLRRLMKTAKKDGFLKEIPSCVMTISIANEKKAKPPEQESFKNTPQPVPKEPVDGVVYYDGKTTKTWDSKSECWV